MKIREGLARWAVSVAVLLRAGSTAAAVLPSNFQESTVFSGLSQPTVGEVRPRRSGVRRREERSHQGLPEPDEHDADGVRGPAHERPQFLGPGAPGPGAASQLPFDAVRLRAVHGGPEAGRDDPDLGDGGGRFGRVSLAAGADLERVSGDGAALAAFGLGQRDDRRGDPDRGLVPAVPEPLDRGTRLRAGRRLVRERGRGSQLQRGRLRAVRRERRHAAERVRGPPGRRRRDADAARRRGRGLAQPGRAPAFGPAGHPRRSDPAPVPDQRPADAGQPAREQPQPQRAPHHRARLPQSVPFRDAAGHERDLGGRRGVEQLGRDRPVRPGGREGAELRLAVLRGPLSPGRLRRRRPDAVRDALRDERRRGRAPLRVRPHREGGRRGDLPDRKLVGVRPRVLHDRKLPGRLRRGALLHRLQPPVHLGDDAGRLGHALSRQRRHLRGGPLGRLREPADRPRRGPLLRGLRRRPHPAHPVLRREPAAGRPTRAPTRRAARRPSRCSSTARARAIRTATR